jgi:hypothetical protein
MTGKDLTHHGGIAFLGSLCVAREGVSLSESSPFIDTALIMAHELGHNFGAEHDGEAGTACASTGGGFIMAPSVSGYSTFSECSLNSMERVIAAADCVTEAQFADVTVDAGVTSVTGEGGLPFTLPFVVRSTGNTVAQDAALTVTLPNNAAFSIDSATSSLQLLGVGLTATCSFGMMDIDASANVTVIARSTTAAVFSVQRAPAPRRPAHLEQQPSCRFRSAPAWTRRSRFPPVQQGAPGRAHRGLRRCELARSLPLRMRFSRSISTGRTRDHAGRDVHDDRHIGDLHDRRSSAGTTRRLTVQSTTRCLGHCSPAPASACWVTAT